MRYCTQKAKRVGGKVVDHGGDIEMNVMWEDAPAGCKVRGKSICGEEQRLTIGDVFQSTVVNARSCEQRELREAGYS